MRARIVILAGVLAAVAGCGAASSSAPVGQTATGKAPARSGSTANAGAGRACPQAPVATPASGILTGLEFVSPARGWAVGQGDILATTDGGAHWRAQLTGALNLTSVDFVSPADGWAVGTRTLLATTDGGAHWTALPEPCPVIRSVHFISPTAGYAVAGGSDVSVPSLGVAGPEAPAQGGSVLATSDGGRTWHQLAAPRDAQTVCFSDPRHGWAGAGGQLYRTDDGGAHWTVLTSSAGSVGSGQDGTMVVECASPDSAWGLRIGPGAAMSQEPHVGYHADASGATAVFAEQYFRSPGAPPKAPSPSAYAGPFSALGASSAVFVDWCDVCGDGTAPWDLATGSGATLTKESNVGDITSPEAASFLSPEAGWVAGQEMVSASGRSYRDRQLIVATSDGGKTWHVQYAGPWAKGS